MASFQIFWRRFTPISHDDAEEEFQTVVIHRLEGLKITIRMQHQLIHYLRLIQLF